jgi:tetratricopeptide (TPR) repeat protein
VERARELVARHRALVADIGLRVTAASASETYGLVEQLAGDDGAAEAEFRRGYDELESLGEKFLSAILAALLAHTLSAQGRNDEALRFGELSERAAGSDDLLAQVQWRTARAKALARTQRDGDAEALARAAVDLLAATDFLVARGDALLDLAEVLRLGGRADDAVPLVTDAVRVYEEKGATVPATRARSVLEGLVSAV